LRQGKSWKGGGKCDLKPFAAVQRVRRPPGRGAARQPEASLAWVAATSLVKRRQRMLKPCVSLDIFLPAEAFGLWNPGAASTRPPQARSLRLDRGPGAGQRHGTDRQGTCEIPFASTGATGRMKERRLTNCSRPGGRPPRPSGAPRRARTMEERVEPATEAIRERDCAGGKS